MERVILPNNDLQNLVNIAKARQVLTGYHYNSLRDSKLKDELSKSELENLGKVIAKIKMHIDREIAFKRGGKK